MSISKRSAWLIMAAFGYSVATLIYWLEIEELVFILGGLFAGPIVLCMRSDGALPVILILWFLGTVCALLGIQLMPN